jgi:hypothetical protein
MAEITLRRVRGDTYPIMANLSITVNKVKTVPDITGSTVTFSYKKVDSDITKSIVGEIVDAVNAVVKFTPTDADFTESGVYRFDIQRVHDGVKMTHILDRLIIEDDITK